MPSYERVWPSYAFECSGGARICSVMGRFGHVMPCC